MPRPETPIPAGPLEEFAGGLRELRSHSNLGYREMAQKANYSTAVLSQAASGRSLPTWDATRAFVRACGGDEERWRVRYEAAAQKWRQQGGATRASTRTHKPPKTAHDREHGAELTPTDTVSRTSPVSTTPAPSWHPQHAEPEDLKDVFVQRLRRLRQEAGKPSSTELRKISGIPASTTYDLLGGRFLRPPRWELVSRFVTACVQCGEQRGILVSAELKSLQVWRRHHTNLGRFLEGASRTETRPIRVLLAEDMDLLRSALVSMLSAEKDIEVIGDLKCDQRVASVALRLRPDVVVVSAVNLAEHNGPAIVSELRGRLPGCPVIALTTERPAGLLKRLVAADVAGMIDKNAPADRLLFGIRSVASGGTSFAANLVAAALAADDTPFAARELDVLRLSAKGASGPEIAKALSMSPSTVRTYMSNVLNKTGARSRIEAIRIASEAGWL